MNRNIIISGSIILGLLMWTSAILVVSGNMEIASIFSFNQEEKPSGMYSNGHHGNSNHHGMMNGSYNDGDYYPYHESSTSEDYEYCEFHEDHYHEDEYCDEYNDDEYCNQTISMSECWNIIISDVLT
ncbi:MAG: hypothetical protein ACW98F_07045 [Candidatus Hodarchaeales archaeon]